MLKIRIPFGFKTIQLDNLFVFYTGKIRIKADYNLIVETLKEIEGLVIVRNNRSNTVTISYVVTDYGLHTRNIKAINLLLHSVMIERLDNKYLVPYGIGTNSIIADELPF